MRLMILTLIMLSIGFFAFYWAYSLGNRHAQEKPVAKKRWFFSRKEKAEKPAKHQPLLLTQLVDFQTDLINRNYAEAGLKLEDMRELTDTYRTEWKHALHDRDELAIKKMTVVIDDLKRVLQSD